MPFEIGKAVSDNTMNLVARRREGDRDAALEAYRLELARRAQQQGDVQALRELQLSYARLGGEGEDRALRRDVAAQESQRAGRALNLSEREQGYRERSGDRAASEGTRQFDVESGHKGRQLDLAEKVQEQETFFDLAGAQRADRHLDLSERGLLETEAKGKFERETEFPATVDLKKQEIGRKGEDSASRRSLNEARAQQARAVADLTSERAKQLLAAGKLTSVGAAVTRLKELTKLYNAAANGPNGPNDEMAADAQARIAALLGVIEKASPDMAASVQRTMGVELGQAMGDPFSATGYGALGSLLDALDKPPAIPK